MSDVHEKRPLPDALRGNDLTASNLALRRVGIDTYRENVGYLHRDCAVYRAEGFQALSKVEVRANGRRILATLNVVDDPAIVACNELGLSEDAFMQLDVKDGHTASVSQAEPPESIGALHRKLAGERLGREDFRAIVCDIAELRYSRIELTAFVVATNRDELDREEVYFLAEAMVDSADVELPFDQLARIVRDHRGCLAWGGTAKLSPADDVLISVERPLAVDSPGQMVASILSKKIAAGSTHLVLDIPIGPTAKVRSMPEAQRLRKLFEYVAARMHLSLDVVITDGRQPVGNGIGPILEARDVMRVLESDPRAPNDLRQKSLRLAGRLIECSPDVRGGDGFAIARDILDSGRALAKMKAIIAAQGEHPFDHNRPQLGALTLDVRATEPGVVTGIDNFQVARVARIAGAPKVIGAGVDLFRKLGDVVATGDVLYRVHAGLHSDLDFARQACASSTGYTTGRADEMPHVFVEF